MAEEKFDETDEGYYVQSGDIREWKWKDREPTAEPKAEPKKVTTKTAAPLTKGK